MYLTHLSLTNFRNFHKFDISLPKGTILIEGANAQGKTTLLEAIYFLSTFTSFHTKSDREIINFIEAKNPLAVSRIVASFESQGTSHQFEVRIIQQQNNLSNPTVRKEVLFDGSKKKANQMIGRFSAVYFIPQMMRILDGTPSERRRYIDMTIAQTIPHYAPILNQYNKLLARRNALLKQLAENRGQNEQQLDYWDEELATKGAKIMFARWKAVKEILPIAKDIFQHLTDEKEEFSMAYLPSLASFENIYGNGNQSAIPTEKEIKTLLLTTLQEKRTEQIYRGITTTGPHRDDLLFTSNGIDLGKYGSRGQIRTTLLTLKMTEIDWIHQTTGNMPVLLLDEVLAELDKKRRQSLLDSLGKFGQALLTTSERDQFSSDFLEKTTLWTIHQGMLL